MHAFSSSLLSPLISPVRSLREAPIKCLLNGKEPRNIGAGRRRRRCGPGQVPWVGLNRTREPTRGGASEQDLLWVPSTRLAGAGGRGQEVIRLRYTSTSRLSTSRHQGKEELLPIHGAGSRGPGRKVSRSRSHLWLHGQLPHSILGERGGRLADREAD